jgi:hypothetical protein
MDTFYMYHYPYSTMGEALLRHICMSILLQMYGMLQPYDLFEMTHLELDFSTMMMITPWSHNLMGYMRYYL